MNWGDRIPQEWIIDSNDNSIVTPQNYGHSPLLRKYVLIIYKNNLSVTML